MWWIAIAYLCARLNPNRVDHTELVLRQISNMRFQRIRIRVDVPWDFSMVHFHEVSPACVRACLTFYSDCVSWSLSKQHGVIICKKARFWLLHFCQYRLCTKGTHKATAVPWGIPNLAGITEVEIAGDNKDNKPLTSTVWCRVVSHFSSHSLRFTWIPWRSNSAKRSWWDTLSNAFDDQRRLRWPRSRLRAVVQ